MSDRPILPGATVGVLGSGQLGRMLALAARAMGYRVHVLSPGSDSPTGRVADREVVAPYDDLDAVAELARGVDVVTFEFENVSSAAAQAAAAHAPVRPAGAVLHTCQNRLREKTFLSRAGFPVAPFRAVRSAAELEPARQEVAGTDGRAVVKTAGFGYDGKGQAVLSADDPPGTAERAWKELGTDEAVVESFVDFEREVSVVAARGLDGAIVSYGPIANDHANHILDVSVSPSPLPPARAERAVELAASVLEELDVVGVLCVEMFVTRNGELLVNELAPRPHNSGHYTIDACETSQFGQQLRAVCGLPLGSTRQHRPAAMANLLGDLWAGGEPDWPAALAEPGVALHLYGKAAARPGRKMGHLTALADDPRTARAKVLAARAALRAQPGSR